MDNEVGRSGVGESFLFFVESERKGDASAEPRVTHRVDSGGRDGMVVKRKRGSLCERSLEDVCRRASLKILRIDE